LNKEHWILLLSWGAFGLLHSLMAAPICKRFFGRLLGSNAVYYRLAYSLVAFITLGIVLFLQFSIQSFYLAERSLLKYVVGLVVGLPGVLLMIVCIRKYFFNLSGVKVFFETDQGAKLEAGGIHAYVRHPLYLGTLAMVWAIFSFFPLLSNLIACFAITVYTLIGIRLEERKLLQVFGEQYAAYRRRTPMLIPNFRPR
jgi:protein-S-isoprenylcysteine O-methyltransferase Ste14